MDTLKAGARVLCVGLFVLGPFVDTVRADESSSDVIPERIQRLPDSEVTARLHFLVERLDAGRDYAWYWWHGWTAFYALGVGVEATRAGLETDYDGRKAEYIIGAVKAMGGVILLLLRPLEAQNGADAVRALPGSSPAERRRQLFVAEEQLKTNAEVSLRRYNWLRHVLNFGINAVGGVIVAQGFDDPSRGARSAGVGTAVGEINSWTQPWWPANDWEEYQHRFDNMASPRLSWRFVSTNGGVAFQMNF